ncbi:MAG: DUF3089 domain-containing protein, partial [Candidatus Gastranaerophilales bacterium]|nr:DUF3089 domain-containing protein [Candidatus Gastranaerophilales bacterium]
MKIVIVLVCLIVLTFSYFKFKNIEEVKPLDYSQKSNWVAYPQNPDKKIDVFYIYPTIYAEKKPFNMDVNRADLREKAQHLLLAQAGVFSSSANLYAPFYQQTTFLNLNPNKDMFKDKYLLYGAKDVENAFNYYLKHSDRPFILAGDSQGSVVLLYLMRKNFNDPELQKRLVAAYLIGYSITDEDLEKYPWIKFAKSFNDNHVVISYNTQAPGATGSPVLKPKAHCINPL